MNRKPRLPSTLADERGAALPVALFGLVAVSLLVTAALLSSSNEVALSRAHQDGTRSIHAGSAALEEFVAARAAMTVDTEQRLTSGPLSIALANGEPYVVTVTELFRGAVVDLPGGAVERRETYSIVAQPQTGHGRGVGALVEAVRVAGAFGLNIDSGLALGSHATISGNVTISDGSDAGAACDSASAPNAIRHASDTTLEGQGTAHDIRGAVVRDPRTASELMSHVLGNRSLAELTELAQLRFGPLFGQPAFNSSQGPGQNAADQSYRWGCPAQLVSGCTSQQAAFFPTVAIDAGGGTVDLTGDHAQGIVIVRNGETHIRGNFSFAGILIVEGKLRITGTPRLEGAVVAMGDEAVIDPGEGSMSGGSALIRFNACQIVRAQRGLTVRSLENAAQRMDTPTFAWFEVIR